MPALALAPAPLRASERVAETLRGAILSLRLPPGEKLDEAALARAHGVSRTPAREAILTLAQEGLIVVRPQAGTYVSRLDADALPETMEARRVLEELLARRAAERLADPAQFRDALKAAREAMKTQDVEAFHAADEAFHAALAKAADAPLIGALAQKLRAPLDRFRRLTLPEPGRMRRVIDEHEAIVAEIARGEPKAAARAVRRHLSGLLDDLPAVRAAHPECFSSHGAAS